MSVRTKICGVTTLADARYASGAGADYIGFIQYESSPRYIQPGRAKEIIEWLHGPEPVGVFVDSTVEHVNATASNTGFRLVQLHGSESPDFCEAIAVPVIKSFSMRPTENAQQLASRISEYVGVAQFALIDTYDPVQHGGTGKLNRFDELRAADFAMPIILAGGLTVDNVSSVVAKSRPFGVDVSSGVEEAPGVKDFDKIDQFIRAVRGDDSEDDSL